MDLVTRRVTTAATAKTKESTRNGNDYEYDLPTCSHDHPTGKCHEYHTTTWHQSPWKPHTRSAEFHSPRHTITPQRNLVEFTPIVAEHVRVTTTTTDRQIRRSWYARRRCPTRYQRVRHRDRLYSQVEMISAQYTTNSMPPDRKTAVSELHRTAPPPTVPPTSTLSPLYDADNPRVLLSAVRNRGA